MANRITLNETSYHGAGAIQEIAGEVKNRGFHKALVCTGPGLYKRGTTGKVTKVLEDAGLAYEVFCDIKSNPTIDNVKAGVEAFKATALITSLPLAAVLPWTPQKPSVSLSTIQSSRM